MPRWQRAELLILLGLLQAIAPVSIDMYLAALPTLEDVFHATAAQVQTTMVTFLAGFALGQLLYGPVSDRFGRKPPLYASLILFAGSSIACAFAPSIGWMSVMRLFQAVGACGGAVIARAMVRDLYPPSEMRRVFSILILVLGVSPVLAPLLGSYLLVWFGWRAAFLTQASIGVLLLFGMHFRLRESMPVDARRPLAIATVVAGYMGLLRDRDFVGAAAVSGFSSAGMFAYIASAPFVFMTLYKVTTQQFGWLFGSVAAGLVFAAQVNGRLPHRIQPWRILRVANIVQLGAAILLIASVVTGIGGLPAVFFGIFVFVATQGFVFPNGSTIAMMRYSGMAGTASALLGTGQFFIAAVAASFLGFLDDPAVPMAVVMLVCAIISLALNFRVLGPHLENAA
jgi:DHA1 family bicyclomycin/chloramphenicol resistance-like MFS transporter